MHAEAHSSHIESITHETSLTSVVCIRPFQHADTSIGWAACGLWQTNCDGQQRKADLGDKAASEQPSSITATRDWQACYRCQQTLKLLAGDRLQPLLKLSLAPVIWTAQSTMLRKIITGFILAAELTAPFQHLIAL